MDKLKPYNIVYNLANQNFGPGTTKHDIIIFSAIYGEHLVMVELTEEGSKSLEFTAVGSTTPTIKNKASCLYGILAIFTCDRVWYVKYFSLSQVEYKRSVLYKVWVDRSVALWILIFPRVKLSNSLW